MWEPDIVFDYKTDSGKKKATYPFDRNVHEDTRGDGWIFDLKTKFASIVNEELRAVGSETQFHPGKLSEIGIDKEADVHLLVLGRTGTRNKGNPRSSVTITNSVSGITR